MSSNITLSKTGYPSVTIHTSRITENFSNAIDQFNLLKTPTNYTDGPEKLVLDFLKLGRVFEFQGFIADDQGTSATTSRTRLINLFKAGGTRKFTYLGTTHSGVMTGLQLREIAAGNATVKFFAVMVSMIVEVEVIGE